MIAYGRSRLDAFPLGALAAALAMGVAAEAQETSPVLDEAFQQQLDAETHSHRDTGCHAELLLNGPPAWQANVDLVEQAVDHINVETLEFENNEGGRDAAALFAEAALRGLQVNVMIDPVQTQLDSSFDIMNFMAEAGVQWVGYWPPNKGFIQKHLFRLHKKILLADGRRAIIGGMNYGTRYFAEDWWRDTNILMTGQIVRTIQEEFFRDWTEQGRPPADPARHYPDLEPTGAGVIRNVDQRPAVGDFDINRLYEMLINRASRQVIIQTPYFIPNDHVRGILANAVKRDVEVIILTNGRIANDLGELLFLPSSLTFRPMLDAGVKIVLWDSIAQHTMHAKAVLVDEALAVIGGYNMSNRSYTWDTENVVVLTEPNQVAAVRDMLAEDLAQPWITPVDDAWFDRMTFWDWLRAWFINLFGWLL